MYSFAGIDARSFQIKSLGPANGDGSYEDFFRLRQLSPNSKLMLSVGGWGEGGRKYSDMVSSSRNRRAFVESVMETMERYKEFDGLDLDWEYPGSKERQGRSSDKANFLKLVRELKQRFEDYTDPMRIFANGRKLELSIAVPVEKTKLQDGYEVYELCQHLDFINLMSYDLRGNWAGVSNLYLTHSLHSDLANNCCSSLPTSTRRSTGDLLSILATSRRLMW